MDEQQQEQEHEQKEVQVKNTPIIYPINIIDVIIVAVCGIVLIYTAMNGNPSETIIGGFMGYLGANIKSGMGQNSKTTTTKTTTTNNPDNLMRARKMMGPGMWYEERHTITPQPQVVEQEDEEQEEKAPEPEKKEKPAPVVVQEEKPKKDHSELNERIKREMACASAETKQPEIYKIEQ